MSSKKGFFYWVDNSALFTLTGILLLFSSAIIVTLIMPIYVDQNWVEPTSIYQKQMYEVADPDTYISRVLIGEDEVVYVQHLKKGFTLCCYKETDSIRIQAPPELDQYVTRLDDEQLKLTSRLLLLRPLRSEVSGSVRKEILELYDPGQTEAFVLSVSDEILGNWVDENYTLLDEEVPYFTDDGTLFVYNPQLFTVKPSQRQGLKGYAFDPNGRQVNSLEELTSSSFGFKSRAQLIKQGERLFASEGCMYCHTDQTRTLIQDTVLNGTAAHPAPPSTASEYIYQDITFMGTRRIGPDISRVALKRPGRDWHKAHFWSPKTASPGSIMPRFQYFFDFDPRGTPSVSPMGVPNELFESLYQYLMTKGSRISPPNKAWWNGKGPINVRRIIEQRSTQAKKGKET